MLRHTPSGSVQHCALLAFGNLQQLGRHSINSTHIETAGSTLSKKPKSREIILALGVVPRRPHHAIRQNANACILAGAVCPHIVPRVSSGVGAAAVWRHLFSREGDEENFPNTLHPNAFSFFKICAVELAAADQDVGDIMSLLDW